MGFFKEFKDDFSQAVNELLPEEAENLEKQENLENDDMVVNTLDSEVDTESELSKLNGLLEQVTEQAADQAVVRPKQVERIEREFTREVKRADVRSTMEEKRRMNEEAMAMNAKQVMGVNPEAITDETTVITEGTSINGDINADGSIDIRGRIGGNVTCNGKLVITGILEGNSNSSEFFADAAKIEGEVNSTGTVKIGIGSVVIGCIATLVTVASSNPVFLLPASASPLNFNKTRFID